ncbi:GDSL Lipase/Acylhydrolase [Coprinopsis sp. MPI-PUGE-AT-0042]|nr:GDSL Lipase/Acylhydrolase [Coprinopsis sp. MPI-PUGE-AT-0042]
MAANVQDVFMLFGDSITQRAWEPGGLGQRLARAYARTLDVVNRGYSGYNSEWALPVFEKCIAKKGARANICAIHILAIWLGANDASLAPSPQHTAVTTFRANIEKMISMLHSPQSEWYMPNTCIILLTPPPINVHREEFNARNPPTTTVAKFDVSRAYADAVVSVAKERDVGMVDVWTMIWEAAGRDEGALERYLPDGVHLSEAGYEVVYGELMKVITERYPESHPDQMGFTIPLWWDVDWTSPASITSAMNAQTAETSL